MSRRHLTQISHAHARIRLATTMLVTQRQSTCSCHLLCLTLCAMTVDDRSKLSNEFYCYTNYVSTKLGGFEAAAD